MISSLLSLNPEHFFTSKISLFNSLLNVSKSEEKLTNPKGEPIFTDGFYAWELSDDGNSGRLTDKQGNVSFFK